MGEIQAAGVGGGCGDVARNAYKGGRRSLLLELGRDLRRLDAEYLR